MFFICDSEPNIGGGEATIEIHCQAKQYHPERLLTKTELAKCERLFSKLDKHTSHPLLSFTGFGEAGKIVAAYGKFEAEKERIAHQLREVSKSAIERTVGLKPGMLLRVSNENGDSSVAVAADFILHRYSAFSSGREHWGWKLTGAIMDSDHLPLQASQTSSHSLSIEMQGTGGTWQQLGQAISSIKTHSQDA